MNKDLFGGLLGLFFPIVCPCCRANITSGEEHLCLHCRAILPFCRLAAWPGNPMETLLEGRIDFVAACALLYFERQGLVRDLIHNIKYKGRQELGAFLAGLLAREISQSKRYSGVDCILKVPLHPRKMRLRGYNQNTVFSDCLSRLLDRPVVLGVLRRRGETSSQTIMNRNQRTEMLSQCFYLEGDERLIGKHVLLVDDVVTTGATLEACAGCLSRVKGLKLSLATMAFTN